MANNEVPQSPREKRYGFAPQVTFGTAIADTAAFTEIDCEPTQVDRDVKELEVAGAHGSRKQNLNDMIVHNRNAMPKVTLDLFAKKEEHAEFFYATMQSVVEGATTPFSKTFTLLDTQPDFQANAGHFLTFIERDPAASKSTRMVDMIFGANTISLGGDEPLRFSLEGIGKALPIITSNPTGTWTRNNPTNLFYRSDIDICTIDFGGGAVNFHLHELEIAFGWEVTGVGQDGAGGFNTFMMGSPVHTFKIAVVKDSDWETGMANHAAGTAVNCRVGWGNATPGTDDGDLDFAFHGKIDGPGGAEKLHEDPMIGVLTGKLLDDGATEPITVILADAIDKVW